MKIAGFPLRKEPVCFLFGDRITDDEAIPAHNLNAPLSPQEDIILLPFSSDLTRPHKKINLSKLQMYVMSNNIIQIH